MEYVADAHALLWQFFIPRRLGAAARAGFLACAAGTAHIYLPAVAIAEVIMAVQKGRLPGASLPGLLDQLKQVQASTNYTLLPLLPETVIASHTLTAIPDIFDRLVVAEARRLGLPLITRDAAIGAAGVVDVVWD